MKFSTYKTKTVESVVSNLLYHFESNNIYIWDFAYVVTVHQRIFCCKTRRRGKAIALNSTSNVSYNCSPVMAPGLDALKNADRLRVTDRSHVVLLELFTHTHTPALNIHYEVRQLIHFQFCLLN